MNKKLAKALKDANNELKKEGHFKNFQITIDEYLHEVNLSNDGHNFPIASTDTDEETIVAINAYLNGLRHGNDNSYPKICDED